MFHIVYIYCMSTGMYLPYRLFQFMTLFIHGNFFFEVFGDHNFEKEAPFVDITLYIVQCGLSC